MFPNEIERNADSHFHLDKLQAEVRRLQDDLEIRHLQRFESSESLLQDVRSRLEGLQTSVCLPAVDFASCFSFPVSSMSPGLLRMKIRKLSKSSKLW